MRITSHTASLRENVREVRGLVGDQMAERDADARDRTLVVRDQRIAKREEQQELGELKEMFGRLHRVLRKHHLGAVPPDQDDRDRAKQVPAESQELRLVREEQTADGVLHRGDGG